MRPPDPDSLLYAQHWEPVLAGPARRVLDRIEPLATGAATGHGPGTLLDLGAGTGSLTLAAADRWPKARILSLDASAGMLSVAQHRVATEWPDDDRERFEWLVADAGSIPVADAAVDVVVSSFMLQLVGDRAVVLRDVQRVLRRGGVLGFITWIGGELRLPADDVYNETVEALAIEEPEADLRSGGDGDYETIAEARQELEALGFSEVDVRADQLDYTWTPDEYLRFKEVYDERELFESLSADDLARLMTALRSRWSELPEDAFTIRAPLVSGVARRSAGT